MFKELIVDRVFDSIATISTGIERFFGFIAGKDQDFIAFLTVATCCLVMTGCHDALMGRGGLLRRISLVLATVAAFLTTEVMLHYCGVSVSRIEPSHLEQKPGNAFRCKFGSKMRALLSEGSRKVYRASQSHSLEHVFLVSSDMIELSPDILLPKRFQMADQGVGWYCFKDGYLWILPPDGADPRTSAAEYHLVREQSWRPLARRLTELGYIIAGLGIFVFRLGPTALRFVVGLKACRGFAVIGVVSFLLLGAHQLRYLHQDHRMQMVTSRDDDGYLLERLMKAHDLKTMDPYIVSNHAYGAVGYYPFAALSYVTGKLGLPISIEALNLYARGLKVLFSIAMLAAVWTLATRHFDRRSAIFSTVMLLTNFGFLQYSSYPYYPDIMMSAASTMAMVFILDLSQKWSDRSFYFAVLFAAISVSIKFITFLLFPFLFVVSFVSVWRGMKGRWGPMIRILAGRCTTALVLSVAVYFACNPYVKYNILSVVPDWKQFYGYYSVETPYLVAGSAATIGHWIKLCYARVTDISEAALVAVTSVVLILMLLALIGSRVAGWSRLLNLKWPPKETAWKTAILILYACLFQSYLFVSVTLPASIDARLVLSTLPFLYIVAAWVVLRAWEMLTSHWGSWTISRREATPATQPSLVRQKAARPWVSRLMVLALTVGTAYALSPRLLFVWKFMTTFGWVPAESSIRDFLNESGLHRDQKILASLQAHIPANFKQVTEGQWQPDALETRMFQSGEMPALYVEDEFYFDSFFSPSLGKGGFNTQQQKQMHEAGSRFYNRLRDGSMLPFSLVHAGSEVTATNDTLWVSTRIRVYANRLSFSENLLHRASLEDSGGKLPEDSAAQLSPVKPILPPGPGQRMKYSWDAPATISLIHVTSSAPTESEGIQVRLEDSGKNVKTLPFQGSNSASSTEHFAVLDPPMDVASMEITTRDVVEGKAPLIKQIDAIAPAPVGINPASSFFELNSDPNQADQGRRLESLLSRLPSEPCVIELDAMKSLSIELRPKLKVTLKRLLLILDDAGIGQEIASCTLEFDDGSTAPLPVKIQTSTNPSHTLMIFESPQSRPVARCKFTWSNRTGSKVVLKLRQIVPDVML